MEDLQNSELRVENVLFSKNKKEIKRIYVSAFEKEDRMPFGMMTAMSCLWNTQFLVFYDNDTLCGLIYLANMFRTTFVMFFAVDEKLRSKGYGSKILAKVQQMHPKNKIIITIEPTDKECEDLETRIRRKNFYLRNGYQETGYNLKLGKLQEIIIKNGTFKKWKFRVFFMLYSNLTLYPPIKKKIKQEQ